jgi:F-type H+-transporting ATPase subunit alpha
MRKIAGPLRLNLAQFRELEAFAEFGSELDATSLAQLDRGRRVVETLKQGQYDPLPVEDQVVAIFAVTEGYLDDVSVDQLNRFESELREDIRARHGGLLAQIADTGVADEDALRMAIEAFKSSWNDAPDAAAEDLILNQERHEAAAMDEDAVGNELEGA